jgi:hypothetical protein
LHQQVRLQHLFVIHVFLRFIILQAQLHRQPELVVMPTHILLKIQQLVPGRLAYSQFNQ